MIDSIIEWTIANAMLTNGSAVALIIAMLILGFAVGYVSGPRKLASKQKETK